MDIQSINNRLFELFAADEQIAEQKDEQTEFALNLIIRKGSVKAAAETVRDVAGAAFDAVSDAFLQLHSLDEALQQMVTEGTEWSGEM
jgi:hypothetical protein